MYQACEKRNAYRHRLHTVYVSPDFHIAIARQFICDMNCLVVSIMFTSIVAHLFNIAIIMHANMCLYALVFAL